MKKDCMARELTVEVIVGAFMVMIFLGLSYFTIILSKSHIGREKKEIVIRFSDVMGLREGDSVVVRGMPVGQVKALRLEQNGVHVIASVGTDSDISIRKGHKMTIVSTSMLGGRHLEIYEGPDDADVLASDIVYQGVDPYDLMSDAAEVINEMKLSIVEGGVLENIKTISSDLSELSTRLRTGKGPLGKLLAEDSTLYDDVSATVASMRDIAERLEEGKGTLGKLLSKDDTLYKDMSDAVASLKEVAEKIEKGEGTAGKFVNDDALYKEVEAVVREVRAAVDDFRETAPVVSFGSVFFGAF